MTDDILIIAESDLGASLRWCQFDRVTGDHGAVHSGSINELGEFAKSLNSPQFYLVLEGYDAISKSIDLPAKTEVQARAAAPFILEDELAAPADETHFALGENRDGKRQVTYIASNVIDGVLEALTGAGVILCRIYTDHGLLAADDDILQVFQAPNSDAIISQNNGLGLRVEADYAQKLVPGLINEVEGPTHYRGDQLALAGAEQRPPLSSNDIIARYVNGVLSGASIDLMQGAYAPTKAWGELWLVWRRAVVLTALIAAVWVGSFAYETWKLSSEIDRLDTETQAAIQEAFPNARSVAQVQARLTELRRGETNQFIQLSSILFASLQENDGTSIIGMRYDEERAEIAVSLSASSFADIEAIKSAIARRGGLLNEGGSRQDNGAILADVTIRRAS